MCMHMFNEDLTYLIVCIVTPRNTSWVNLVVIHYIIYSGTGSNSLFNCLNCITVQVTYYYFAYTVYIYRERER